jgi:hypothetical protein
MPVPIDRSRPLYRDDPVIAALTDEEVEAFVAVLAQCIRSRAEQLIREIEERSEPGAPEHVA